MHNLNMTSFQCRVCEAPLLIIVFQMSLIWQPLAHNMLNISYNATWRRREPPSLRIPLDKTSELRISPSTAGMQKCLPGICWYPEYKPWSIEQEDLEAIPEIRHIICKSDLEGKGEPPSWSHFVRKQRLIFRGLSNHFLHSPPHLIRQTRLPEEIFSVSDRKTFWDTFKWFSIVFQESPSWWRWPPCWCIFNGCQQRAYNGPTCICCRRSF